MPATSPAYGSFAIVKKHLINTIFFWYSRGIETKYRINLSWEKGPNKGKRMSKILVIDDEASIQKLLTAIFERGGHEVMTAGNGNEGIALLDSYEPDLIVCDLLMPEKEGLETIREIREKNADVKIIAISGGGVVQPEMYLKLAEKVGANQSFTKPVNSSALMSAVNTLLAN